MAKYFITGAAGFIGFHVAQTLVNRGDEVIGYDNFNDYYSPQLKERRAILLAAKGIPIIRGDLSDQKKLIETIESAAPTHLLHLAAQAGVRYSLSNPQAYIDSNITGFLNILEACRRHTGIKLVYASSSSVYGRNTSIPFSVEDRTDHQASLYGVTKKTNELMADTYHHLFGVSTIGLRFFTVYGPWGRPDMAYYSFTEAILKGEPIKIFNHGKLQRDFTYIDDIVDGVVAALDFEGKNEIFNLGNHQPVNLGDFVAALEEALERKAKRVFVEMQPGDVLTTYADISDATERLGFIPKTGIREGLKKFVAWYLSYQGKS